jgi:hypothetical protein
MVPFTITAKFTGERGCIYEFGGKDIDLGDGKTPLWKGSEDTLLAYFKLPAGSKITEAKWKGGYKTVKGKTVRYATFTGQRPGIKDEIVSSKGTVTVTTATYEYATYDTVATYSNGEEPDKIVYHVTANAEYAVSAIDDPGMPTWLKAVIGTAIGIAVIAVVISLILWLIRRKRHREDGGAAA